MKNKPTSIFPVAFYFNVEFKKGTYVTAIPFQEVSGLTVEMETEEIKEGGENGFSYQVPTRMKHGNLVLKRALAPVKNDFLEGLASRPLNGDAISSLTLFDITVNLLGENSDPLRSWLLTGAYPVKWDMVPFAANKNEIAVETMEFSYTKLQRKL